MNLSHAPDHTPKTEPESPPYNRLAIFDTDGPFQPDFMAECIRTLFRTLPLETGEPDRWRDRRMQSALLALAALHPRDEIEIMLGVQAMSAYHAAAACWRLGMNHHRPHGDSTRHMAAAGSAARTFDSLLKALERRQAKPLAIPVGRPPPRQWPRPADGIFLPSWNPVCERAALDTTQPDIQPVWTIDTLALAESMRAQAAFIEDNQGLDLANTEGILPGGGMIVPEDPTPEQTAYLARRLILGLRRTYQDNLRQGIDKLPALPRIYPGDLIE